MIILAYEHSVRSRTLTLQQIFKRISMQRKNAEISYVFDLDNTLIMTDDANNQAYIDAIQMVIGQKPQFDINGRFTRNDLRIAYPQLADDLFNRIVLAKQDWFDKYVDKTILNVNLAKILRTLSQNGNETILLTNCHRRRATHLCVHYNIHQFFCRHYYYEDSQYDKYSFLQNKGYDLRSVVLFENDSASMKMAIEKGICKENIIAVKF